MDQWSTVTRGSSALVGILAAAATVVLAACSGIPSSTTPQVVQTLNANPAPVSITPPAAATDPRTIVSGFVHANADADTSHTAAQLYLTAAAAQTWKQDAVATIFSPAGAPSVKDAHGNVRITGTQVGTLSAAGSFSLPSVSSYHVSFHLIKTPAGWRITNPPTGLLLRADDFRSYYHVSPLFFFSSDQSVLVPDLRYSSATGQSLADLLLTQLLTGPSTSSNLSDEFPSQIVNTKVTVGTPIEVQLPGFGKLTADNRTRIAAEIAYTFGGDEAFPGRPIEIQDGVTPVPISAGGNTFTESSAIFDTFNPMRRMNGQSVYFVRKGSVYNESGHPIDSVYGGSATGVSSVAVSTRVASGEAPLEAAVVSDGHDLMIGNAGTLDTVKLPAAATSRPDWTRTTVPEAWIGVGHSLLRVSSSGVISAPAVQISGPPGTLSYRSVDSVQFSPDGARVALVLSGVGTNASSSGWIGSVVRSAGIVSIQGLYQFTPKGWYVRDVAWTDALTLDVIDNPPTSLTFRIYSLRSDGSHQEQLTSANEQLPPSPAPRWITAGTTSADQADTWVSVGTGSSATLWRLLPAPNWLAPFGTSSYLGSAPIYSS